MGCEVAEDAIDWYKTSSQEMYSILHFSDWWTTFIWWNGSIWTSETECCRKQATNNLNTHSLSITNQSDWEQIYYWNWVFSIWHASAAAAACVNVVKIFYDAEQQNKQIANNWLIFILLFYMCST